jgi:hypothetical protein
MDKVWFRKKRVGFGLRPSGMAGWLTTLFAALALSTDGYLYRIAVIPSRPLFLIAAAGIVVVFGTLVFTHREQ